MHANQQVSEGLAILASIDPSSQGAGTLSTAWVSVQNFHNFMAQVKVGVFGGSATVDANVYQAQDNSGTGSKALTGKAITQLLAAGGNNRQALINFRTTDLDTTNGFGYVRLNITVGTAATLTDGTLYGANPRFEPVKDATANPAINLGASSVAQIV